MRLEEEAEKREREKKKRRKAAKKLAKLIAPDVRTPRGVNDPSPRAQPPRPKSRARSGSWDWATRIRSGTDPYRLLNPEAARKLGRKRKKRRGCLSWLRRCFK